MIEKIPLPMHSRAPRRGFLPFRYHLAHTHVIWKRNQPMRMIRHQQKKMYIPFILIMSKRHRIEQLHSHHLMAQLILPAWFTANRDKEHRIIMYPCRTFMRQTFPFWQRNFHAFHIGLW
jgi:hypothetical protein